MPFTGCQLINAVFTAVITVSFVISGCAEQPAGYIFVPSQRDITNTARVVATVISSIYDHTDEAVSYLDRSSLTDDYASILPSGWQSFVAVDTASGEPYVQYMYNYLDQKYYFLRFDRFSQNGAIRTPSSLDYTFIEIRSYQNLRTNEFYGNISKINQLTIEYSDNRSDPFNVDGWFEVRTSVPVDIEIEAAGVGTITITDYVPVNWQFFVEKYSIDKDDQNSRIVMTGVLPLYDETFTAHFTQISGEINVNRVGRGGGDITLWGEPAIRLRLTGRTHKFNGYFTLHEEDHEWKYFID